MNAIQTKTHSPTPWRACKEGDCSCGMVWSLPQDFPVFTARGADGRQGYVGEAHTFMADTPDDIYAWIEPEQAKANAAFIVKAVNAWDSIDALEARLAELRG